MADLTVTAANVRPLEPAFVVQGEAAATLAPGDSVYKDNNGKYAKSTGASGLCVGIVLAGSNKKASIPAGEQISVCVFGRVTGFSGLSKSRLSYLSATAGKLADSGTVKVGYAYDDTTVFVMPNIESSAS